MARVRPSFATPVRKGCEQEYGEWRSRITTALSGHPGFQRVEVYPPDEVQSDWVTIERYDSVADARSGSPAIPRRAGRRGGGPGGWADSVAIIVDEGFPSGRRPRSSRTRGPRPSVSSVTG